MENKKISANLLKSLSIPGNFDSNLKERPEFSFYQLSNFIREYYKMDSLIISSEIIMDENFSVFAKENNLTINCLHQDAILVWSNNINSSNDNGFVIQGVFEVFENSNSKNKFLLCSLFHKGNQFDDEVSNFLLLNNNQFDWYSSLLDKYSQWMKSKDRANSFVRVIEGEDFSYDKSCSWEDLFLDEVSKKEIKNTIENFLNSKDFYLSNKIPWKRGMLLYGPPGNGKSSIIKTIMANYDFKPITIIPEADNNMMRDAFSYAEEQSPSLLYFEDLDSLLERNLDVSLFLNLMDGISAKNGIFVIATANDIKKLKTSITDRPSRFDRKYNIKLPDFDMSLSYLKKWFGTMISLNEIKTVCKQTVASNFSYAYLKELYISSMFEAISKNRKKPTMKDIDTALKRLIKDKNLLNKTIDTERYFQ